MTVGQTVELRIDPEFRALIPPPTQEERDQLEANLVADGCRDPLVAWRNGKLNLIDGHNRYEICTRLGIKFQTIEKEFGSRDDAKSWIIRNQFGRRNLAAYQRAELAMKLEPIIAAKAKEKQQAGGARADGNGKVVRQKTDKPLETKKELAGIAGVSHDTIHKAKIISAKATEPVKEKLRRGETTINKEYKAIVKAERHAEQVKAVAKAEVPKGKFNVIVADPPWAYESRAEDSTHRAANPYPSMTVEKIAGMGIESLATEDAILWLWTTNAFIVQAHQIAERWGFKVKTILTWAKDRMGTGDWLRGQTEHCLMAVRGKPVITLTNQTTLLRGPLRQHSRKPDEFYALVESLCPGKKCELFSRQTRDGWVAAGAEVEKFSA